MRIALAYPNTYYIGMSNLGFQTVYALLNQNQNVVCERVFLPDDEEENLLRKYHSPLLSYESQKPIKEFDLLLFSISFENDYLNVLKIISLSGLPLLSQERKIPLVAAGGIAIWLNPEPLADFIDFFLIGEAEIIIEEFIKSYLKYIGEEKNKFLYKLAQSVAGIYVPSGYEVAYKADGTIKKFLPKKEFPFPIIKKRMSKLNGNPAHTQILTQETEFSKMFLIEIERGCFYGCRFCAAGYLYRPPRMWSLGKICQIIQKGLKFTSKIGLIGAAINDYPHLEALLKFLLEKEAHFSVSSLRLDKLKPYLLEALRKSHHKTITLAPEAGTQRLRNVINKNFTEENILEAAIFIAKYGFINLKLYFIIGLPTEKQEDLEGIFTLIKKIKKTMLDIKNGRFYPHIHLSIASFVPKPFTPFQWHPMETIQNLKQKIRWLKNVFKHEKGVSIAFDFPKWAYTQALLSRGDRRVGNILFLALKKDWTTAFKQSPLNPDFFVYRDRDKNEIFPWEIINHGLKKDFLYEEYKKALSNKSSPPCPGKNCHICGVCIKH